MKRKILCGLLTTILFGTGLFVGYKIGYINNHSIEYIPKEDYSIISIKKDIITNQETAEKIADRILREKGTRGDKPLEVFYDEKEGLWVFDGGNFDERPNVVTSVIITRKGTVRVVNHKK